MIVESNFGISDYDSLFRKLFAGYTYLNTKTKDGELYGIGFYARRLEQIKDWIKTDPDKAVKRLQKKSNCIYCDVKLDNLLIYDDVFRGETLSGICLPSCESCYNSKNKMDLIKWWKLQGKNILTIKKDVFSIYIRRMYKQYFNLKFLDQPIDQRDMYMLDDLKLLGYYLEPKTLDQWNK